MYNDIKLILIERTSFNKFEYEQTIYNRRKLLRLYKLIILSKIILESLTKKQ